MPNVSIPSRGSGKGDFSLDLAIGLVWSVSIPSRGSGKGDLPNIIGRASSTCCFNPLSGKW